VQPEFTREAMLSVLIDSRRGLKGDAKDAEEIKIISSRRTQRNLDGSSVKKLLA